MIMIMTARAGAPAARDPVLRLRRALGGRPHRRALVTTPRRAAHAAVTP